jgi:hypothetical protein
MKETIIGDDDGGDSGEGAGGGIDGAVRTAIAIDESAILPLSSSLVVSLASSIKNVVLVVLYFASAPSPDLWCAFGYTLFGWGWGGWLNFKIHSEIRQNPHPTPNTKNKRA